MEWVLDIRHDALTLIFRSFAFLGDKTFFLAFMSLGYWLVDRRLFKDLGILLLFSGLFNAALKGAFAIPRPQEIPHLEKAGGWSFPSGHAQTTTAVWSWLALEWRKPGFWLFAIGLMVGVAFSRIYLGVHRPIDVVAGAILGGTTVAIGWMVLRSPPRFWRRLPRGARAALICGGTILWCAVLPDAGEPIAGAAAGALCGFWVGDLYRAEDSRCLAKPWDWRFLAAGTLGLAVAFVLRIGLKSLFASIGLDTTVADFLRYAAIGSWVSWFAPEMFFRLSLATTPGSEPATSP